MKRVVIIPARYNSTRLPGKPLLDIEGKPMIIRVCESVKPGVFDAVVVATDDERILTVVKEAGYPVVLTKADHVSGTDRLQEAAEILGLADHDVVINLQGDEPLMPYENLTQVSDLLIENPEASVATLYENMLAERAIQNSNVVKLVQAVNRQVLYFSRAPIPFDRDNVRGSNDVVKRHVGVYAYRKQALDKFIHYSEGTLEKFEKLEQLRFMENGDIIFAEKAKLAIPVGVDTVEDLNAVRQIFKGSVT